MQVEHITLSGNSTLRDTDAILKVTIDFLKDFQIREGEKTLPFPTASFSVKITAVEQGAIFNIEKAGIPAIVNVCNFKDQYSREMFEFVGKLDVMQKTKPRLPVMEHWLYSILVNPFCLSAEEAMLAGEIELYIYYSLYLARKND
jgi:hypothetical protein